MLSIGRDREERNNINGQFAKTMVIDGKVAKMWIQIQKNCMLMWQKKEGNSVILIKNIMHTTMLMFFWLCRKKEINTNLQQRVVTLIFKQSKILNQC